MDEPAPKMLARLQGVVWVCADHQASPSESGEAVPADVHPGCDDEDDVPGIRPDERDEIWTEEREWLESIAPAEGSERRIVARLFLPSGKRAHLITWRTRSAKLCLDSHVDDARWDDAGPWGPCLEPGEEADVDCEGSVCLSWWEHLCGDELCLVETADDLAHPRDRQRFILLGVVAAEADRLDVELRDGETLTYPLTGPRVPGSADERIFMADLGRCRYRTLELFDGDRLLARSEVPEYVVRMDECLESVHDEIDVEELPPACLVGGGVEGPEEETPPDDG